MIQPTDIEIEKAVLGACLLEKTALEDAAEHLNTAIFYYPENIEIVKAINLLLSESQPVDILTVTNQLRKVGKLNDKLTPLYITELTSRVNQSENVVRYATMLKELYLKRELIKIGQAAQKQGFDPQSDAFDSLDSISQMLLDLSNHGTTKGARHVYEVYEDNIKRLERISSGDEEPYIQTGMKALDRALNIGKSDLIILAARPAMGKTAVSIQAALEVSKTETVAFYSLEMSKQQLTDRALSNISSVPFDRIKNPDRLNQSDWQKLTEASNEFKTRKLYLNDSVDLSVIGIRAECRRLQKKHGLGLIVLDYIQLMTDKSSQGGNREQEVSRISRGLKLTAKALDVPVLALAQLSRAVETRGGDKRPQLSDLRESGSIEQDADAVLFLCRPEYYDITEDENGQSTEGLLEIIISKNRNGNTGSAIQKFEGQFQRISEFEEDLDFKPLSNNSLASNNDPLSFLE